MTDADQHYENRFGSWEFKMAYVRWKYKFRFLAMQMWLQPIGWSSICRFLKFLLTFLWKAKILKKCRIDAGNWPARNSPIEPIQWIIQVIAFIFGWKRERAMEIQNKTLYCYEIQMRRAIRILSYGSREKCMKNRMQNVFILIVQLNPIACRSSIRKSQITDNNKKQSSKME